MEQVITAALAEDLIRIIQGITMTRSLLTRCACMVGLVVIATTGLVACGETEGGVPTDVGAPTGAESDAATQAGSGSGGRSAVTGREQIANLVLTEEDTGRLIEAPFFRHDIGQPDQKGVEIKLSGDDSSTLRWRMAELADPLIMEWHAVDGKLAFETDGLLGDPATAAKLVELRGNSMGEATFVFELVEGDPAKRTGPPAKRLEFMFTIPKPRIDSAVDAPM